MPGSELRTGYPTGRSRWGAIRVGSEPARDRFEERQPC